MKILISILLMCLFIGCSSLSTISIPDIDIDKGTDLISLTNSISIDKIDVSTVSSSLYKEYLFNKLRGRRGRAIFGVLALSFVIVTASTVFKRR